VDKTHSGEIGMFFKEKEVMKKGLWKIILAILLLPVCTYATVLTFDDIGTGISGHIIPYGYGGFGWYAISYLDPSIVNTPSGYANGVVSGNCVALVSNYPYEGIGWLTGSPFTFNGTYLTAVWRDGLNVKVDGYLSDVLIYSTTVVVNTTGPTWYEFNYANIDELRFSASGGTQHEGYEYNYTQFVMDNFAYIPEPISLVLFGLGGLALRKRK
jgi:hypothetical protein